MDEGGAVVSLLYPAKRNIHCSFVVIVSWEAAGLLGGDSADDMYF